MISKFVNKLKTIKYFCVSKTYDIEALKNNKWQIPDPTFKESIKTHKSDAQLNINKLSVIEIEDDIARCCGGHITFGHPTVYIKLNENTHSTCKYCGLRFKKIAHH